MKTFKLGEQLEDNLTQYVTARNVVKAQGPLDGGYDHVRSLQRRPSANTNLILAVTMQQGGHLSFLIVVYTHYVVCGW